MRPPVFFISNRSIFLGYYHVHTADDGEYTFIQSSIGNEKYVEQNYERIGSDVLADVFLNYIHVKPIYASGDEPETPRPLKEDPQNDVLGCLITQVIHMNPGGTIPERAKAKMTQG